MHVFACAAADMHTLAGISARRTRRFAGSQDPSARSQSAAETLLAAFLEFPHDNDDGDE